MKTALLILLIFVTKFSFSQKKISEIDTLSYDQMSNKETSKKFKFGMSIKVYVASDKNYYKVGDTLILGQATGEGQSNFSKKRNYNYVFYGSLLTSVLVGTNFVQEQFKGYPLKIERIQFSKNPGKLQNNVLFYTTQLPNKRFENVHKFITVTMVDDAIANGEIIPHRNTRPMTREEAIEYLKKKKEELDIEIISKEEFEKIKNQLAHIIKGESN